MTDSDPETVLVRGGSNRDAAKVMEVVQAAEAALGLAVLSVHVDEVREQETPFQTLYRICEGVPVPHSQVQVSTLARVRGAGFKVIHEVGPGESPYHHHVYFEVPVTESRVQQFVDCLDQPVPNPTGGKRKKL